MRSFRAPSTFASAIRFLSLSTQISATPFWWPSDVSSEQAAPTSVLPYEEPHNVTLELRACANPCGWYGQLCCQTGETCYTDANNQAQCGSGSTITSAASGGYWQYYTSTWVESQAATHTTVWSSYFPASVTAAATAVSCNYALNQSPCGSICCSSGQYCVTAGTCAAAGGGSSEGSGGTAVVVGGGATASAPLRPTTGTVVVSTASATTTLPFSTPVATGANVTLTGTQAQSSGGLSGGAIAGIVIGVILGLALLFLLCFCLCVRGLFGLFGGKKQKKGRVTETEYIEEYHHHSGGGAAVAGGAAGGRRWYGDRPASRPPPPKKSGGIGGLGATAAGLGALAIALGLKRKHDKKQAKTEYTGSSYEYSYYGTSDTSSSSDDRRTRRSSRH